LSDEPEEGLLSSTEHYGWWKDGEKGHHSVGMETETFAGTVGYDAHTIRGDPERDIHFSGISYKQHILQGSRGWAGDRLGDRCNSLFIQKENGKTMSGEERVAFAPA
jgi:hypothetical protein